MGWDVKSGFEEGGSGWAAVVEGAADRSVAGWGG